MIDLSLISLNNFFSKLYQFFFNLIIRFFSFIYRYKLIIFIVFFFSVIFVLITIITLLTFFIYLYNIVYFETIELKIFKDCFLPIIQNIIWTFYYSPSTLVSFIFGIILTKVSIIDFLFYLISQEYSVVPEDWQVKEFYYIIHAIKASTYLGIVIYFVKFLIKFFIISPLILVIILIFIPNYKILKLKKISLYGSSIIFGFAIVST